MDTFTPAILLTIIGMGVVFGSLLILMAVIQLLERLLDTSTGRRKKNTNAENGEVSPENDDLAFVLAAAAGYFGETEMSEVRVPKVRRDVNSVWAQTTRLSHLSQQRRR